MAKLHSFDDPQVQTEMAKANAGRWSPEIDLNMQRKPDRMIHVFSTSQREFRIDRAPLWSKLILRACPRGTRYVPVLHIPDPFMQAVHDVERAKRRGEANDGMLVAVELLNPNNPTYDPDWVAPAELAAEFGSSRGCDLFSQGLFLSLNEEPTEQEIRKAELRKERRYRQLIAQADSLEQINRKELEEFLKGEDGTDLRMALDYFGEQRAYHKPMIATRVCPNCGETIKSGQAFHLLPGGAYCINDWQKAIEAGVKTYDDVPAHLRKAFVTDDGDDEDVAEPVVDAVEAPAPRRTGAGRPKGSKTKKRASK